MGTAGIIFVSILTLNIWGLPDAGFQVLSPLREERVAKICEALKEGSESTGGWDAVLLQEVWLKQDRDTLKKCGYPHHVDLNDPKRVIDSGLLILSKYPLESAGRMVFPSLPSGAQLSVDGESLARKSANVVKMVHPKAGAVWLANTHLVSFYAAESEDNYYEIRRRQFVSFARWAQTGAGGKPLIVGGDLNFGPHNKRLWDEKKKELPGFVASSDSERISTLSSNNTFQTVDQGRVDHVFASAHFQPVRGHLSLDRTCREGDLEFNVSDHYGWTEVFSLPVEL